MNATEHVPPLAERYEEVIKELTNALLDFIDYANGERGIGYELDDLRDGALDAIRNAKG